MESAEVWPIQLLPVVLLEGELQHVYLGSVGGTVLI